MDKHWQRSRKSHLWETQSFGSKRKRISKNSISFLCNDPPLPTLARPLSIYASQHTEYVHNFLATDPHNMVKIGPKRPPWLEKQSATISDLQLGESWCLEPKWQKQHNSRPQLMNVQSWGKQKLWYSILYKLSPENRTMQGHKRLPVCTRDKRSSPKKAPWNPVQCLTFLYLLHICPAHQWKAWTMFRMHWSTRRTASLVYKKHIWMVRTNGDSKSRLEDNPSTNSSLKKACVAILSCSCLQHGF